MSERESDFVEYVVKAIVEKPDAVVVNRSLDQKGVFLELQVDPEDVGKVIGKKGATINAIRSLLRVLGAKYDARYSLKVIEPEGFSPRREDEDSSTHDDSTVETEAPAEAHEEAEVEQDNSEQEVDDIKSRAREGLEDLDDLEV